MMLKSNKTGSILIMSLWILAILSILAMGLGFRSSIEARLSKYNMDRLKALYLAKAGVIKCQDILSSDNNNYISVYECGINLPPEQKLEDIFMNVKIADDSTGYFSVSYNSTDLKSYPGMMDEERKININRAPEEVLKSLLQVLGSEGKLPIGAVQIDEIISSIECWRSPAPGADDHYYESLVPPYQCKHAFFCAIEELLLVKGMTLEIFSSIKDYITVFGPGDGRNNVNTAPKEVLMALGMPEMLANKVISFRNGPDGKMGTEDDQIFLDANTIDSVLNSNLPGGLTDDEVLVIGDLKSKQCFTTVSNYFRIKSKGVINASRIEKKIVCVAARDTANKGVIKLISYREY